MNLAKIPKALIGAGGRVPRAGRSRPPPDTLTTRLNQRKNYLRWRLKGLSSRHGHRKFREHRNRWVRQCGGRKGARIGSSLFVRDQSLDRGVPLETHCARAKEWLRGLVRRICATSNLGFRWSHRLLRKPRDPEEAVAVDARALPRAIPAIDECLRR